MAEAKPLERGQARTLRRNEGCSIKTIAHRLKVSTASAGRWTHDIVLTPEQLMALGRGGDGGKAGARRQLVTHRERRQQWQEEGRRAARVGRPTHRNGCILYWAEGTKCRNACRFSNGDADMMRLFVSFLRDELGVRRNEIKLRLNFYDSNGLAVAEIENYWLDLLDLPRASLGQHTIKTVPPGGKGSKRRKRMYGIAYIAVYRTDVVQHILGAIQEYAEIDVSEWLDC